MVETGASDGQLPGDTDGLAEALLEACAKFLRAQNLIRVSERAEERIRRHGIDPGGELAEGRVQLGGDGRPDPRHRAHRQGNPPRLLRLGCQGRGK
jgi:hypothetical protein